MESAISSCPYEPRQSSSLTTGTSTFIRTLARLPPSEVVPHPETVQVVPAVYSSPSDGSMILSITELLKSANLSCHNQPVLPGLWPLLFHFQTQQLFCTNCLSRFSDSASSFGWHPWYLLKINKFSKMQIGRVS